MYGDRGVPASIRRLAYRVGAHVLVVYRFVFRPTVRGVRCTLMRGGEVLLVRHTYGDRRWALPGGLARRGEEAQATARREMREELGLDIATWRDLGTLRFRGPERAQHVVACLSASLPGPELEPNAAEIAEARWFGHADVPGDALEQTAEIVAMAFRPSAPG